MRLNAKRLFLMLMWLLGIVIFINIERFYSIYKSKNTPSVSAYYVSLLKSGRIHDKFGKEEGNKNTIKSVEITSRNDDITHKTRNIIKTKLPEKTQHQGGPCNLTKLRTHLETNDNTWQQVDVDNSMYVFSAYYTQFFIYIIGAKPRRQVKVLCQLWASNENGYLLVTKETVASVDYALRDGYTERYTSAIFICPIDQREIPTHVSLVTGSCENPLNLLQVHDVTTTGLYQTQFTVCLSPLNFRYGRAYELVEWIELNRILGADKFVVYNYSSAINVAQVLDYYTHRKTTEVIQWKLPMDVDTFPKTNEPIEIRYFGQTAALNDCLFRCKKTSKYVVNLDVDEFIIPHSVGTNNWYDMINQLETVSVHMFQNTFFRKDWGKDEMDITEKELVDKLRLVTLQVYQREKKIFPAKFRSKYIVRTSNVNIMLTHEVPHARMLTVPIDIGLLHHYRDWENPYDKKEWVNDTTVLEKFKTPLIENVKNVWRFLSQVKMDIPII